MLFKDKYTVGNVCLVVFLAFIFSLLIATVKVQPAFAAPAMTMPQDGTAQYDTSNGALRLNVTLRPVSSTNFGSLRYYVKMIQEGTGTQLALGTTEYVYFTATSATSVYGTVYDNLVSLLYAAPTGLNLATTFNVVYSTLTQTSTPDAVYLTLIYRPPTTNGGGGGPPPAGGGGGGGPVPGGTTVTGSTGAVTIDVLAGTTTIAVDTSAVTTQANNLASQTPTVITEVPATTGGTTTTTTTTAEVTYALPLVKANEAGVLQPNTAASIPSTAIDALLATQATLQQQASQAPPAGVQQGQQVHVSIEVQIPFAGGSLAIPLDVLAAALQQAKANAATTGAATPTDVTLAVKTVPASDQSVAGTNQTLSGSGYLAASDTYVVTGTVTIGGVEVPVKFRRSSLRPVNGALYAAQASDAPIAAAQVEKLAFFKLTMKYSPNSTPDTDRLAAYIKDVNGNGVFIPRVVVNHDKYTADVYLDRFGSVSMVQWTKSLSDISTHWASSEIVQMASRGVVQGYPDGKFDPNGSVTRAQFAAMVLRTLGVDQITPDAPKFKDVPVWTWYFQAVETAAKLGLVNGYEDGNFKPNAKITRAEMAAIIMRAETLVKDVTITTAEATDLLKVFADAGAVPAWARESSAKALKTGIVQGRTQTAFQPLSDATRAESVVMLKRLLKYNGHIQ